MSKIMHGLACHPLYNTWRAMRARCYNQNAIEYDRYGGRGITVCPEWRESPAQFISDMGPKPTPKHTVERTNNDLGYSPENCRWATMTEQQRNKRMDKRNKSGVTGVCWFKPVKRWQVRINANRKTISLGYFNNISEAAEARKQGEIKYWKTEEVEHTDG